MKKRALFASIAIAALTQVVIAGGAATAQDYPFKIINLIVGEPAGGGYDTYARLLARHMARHIPGQPTIVTRNMPGAGSLVAMNHIFNVAPRDGSTFGTVQRSIIIMPLMGMSDANFAPDKLFYLGSMDQDVGVCIVRREAGIKSLEDVKTREMIIGTEGAVSDINGFTNPLIKALGLKFKIVTGYHGTGEINLAIDRGEIDGRCGVSYTSLKRSTSFLQTGRVNVLVQIGLSKLPELAQTPLVTDFPMSNIDRSAIELLLAPTAISRPFFMPPGVPRERAEVLRDAFDAMLADPEFTAEATQAGLAIRSTNGKDMQSLVEKIYQSSPAVVERAKSLVAP
jgi:tripartite-type tricarboxylate transporter receptor subunit TctC